MKRLIHRYLSEFFYIKGAKVYSFSKEVPKSSKWLSKDLELVFDIPKDKLKWYLKSWCWKQNKGFDFKEFWNPTFKSINVRTLYGSCYSAGFLAVQAMSQPSGRLHYLEHHYEPIKLNVDVIMEFCGTTTYAPYVSLMNTPPPKTLKEKMIERWQAAGYL